MTIRPATFDDVPAVLPMVEKVCAFHQALDPAKYNFRDNPGEMYRGWLRQRAMDDRSVFLVADAGNEEKSKLIGMIVGSVVDEIPIYRLDRYGFLHDLWVEENYRNEGAARQLVTLAVERFKEIGVKQVRLDAACSNAAARGLFTACGFRESIVEMLIEV